MRIMQQRSLSFWDFICRWADPQGEIARQQAPHFHFIDEPQTPFVMCLLHAPSQTFAGTTKCQFLSEESPSAESPLGRGRCSIYEHRPSACKIFPAKLAESGELAILYDPPPNGRPQTPHPAYQLCPRAWTPEDVDPIQHMEDLVVARYEMNFFRMLANSWNEDPGEWALFPEFLQLVYSQRIRPATDTQVQPFHYFVPDGEVPDTIPMRRAA